MDPPLRVAIVAASLRILGGQAVQAQRLLDAWQDDPTVKARLVPINPVPPLPLAGALRIQIPPHHRHPAFLLAAAFPRVAAGRRRPRVFGLVRVVPPGAAPSGADREALRSARRLNYHSGEAPDHLRRSALARHVMRTWVDLNVVPSVPPPRAPGLRDQRPGGALTPSTCISSRIALATRYGRDFC